MATHANGSTNGPGRERGVDERATRERLSRSVESAQEELRSTLGQLKGVVASSVDWREWVRERPWACVGVAAAFGWRIGRGRWL